MRAPQRATTTTGVSHLHSRHCRSLEARFRKHKVSDLARQGDASCHQRVLGCTGVFLASKLLQLAGVHEYGGGELWLEPTSSSEKQDQARGWDGRTDGANLFGDLISSPS